ncbi:MAG: hypothetical protein ACT4OQ_08485 [Chloroflexota bacterium]
MISGVIAGATGELALNVASYADMVIRARPSSSMPGKVAGRMADLAGVELSRPGERADIAETRKEASGALLGYGMAVGTAVAFALLRRAGMRLPVPLGGVLMGGAAMAVSDSAATALGATDPATWGVSGWLADIIPHAIFGVAAAATLELLDP